MKCPHLQKWVVSVCKADADPYVPSNFQLHEYCRTKRHNKCPLYSKDMVKVREFSNTVQT